MRKLTWDEITKGFTEEQKGALIDVVVAFIEKCAQEATLKKAMTMTKTSAPRTPEQIVMQDAERIDLTKSEGQSTNPLSNANLGPGARLL
jgi:hypothetical protein